MKSHAFVFDAMLLVAYAVVSFPFLIGVAAHEWLGLALFAIFAAHLAARSDRLFPLPDRNLPAAGWARFVLTILIVVVLCVCVVSGLLESGVVLPVFGVYAPGGYFVWKVPHAVSAKILAALFLVHVASHARWVAGQVRKFFRKEGRFL